MLVDLFRDMVDAINQAETGAASACAGYVVAAHDDHADDRGAPPLPKKPIAASPHHHQEISTLLFVIMGSASHHSLVRAVSADAVMSCLHGNIRCHARSHIRLDALGIAGRRAVDIRRRCMRGLLVRGRVVGGVV